MNLLYVHSSNELYGADIVLSMLVKGLDAGAYRPLVVLPCDVPYEGLLSQELGKSGIPYRILDHAVLRRMYFRPLGIVQYVIRLVKSTTRLSRLIRQEKIDLVHSNTSAVLAGALAAKITGTPHIWHIHEIITQPRFLLKVTSTLACVLSDRVVAVSGPVAEHLARATPAIRRKMTVIHNGIDLDVFHSGVDGRAVRREVGVAPGEVLIGMMARVSHWKGQEQLVMAAAKVVECCPSARFVLVGGAFPGQEYRVDRLRQMVESLGLQDRVAISGFRRDAPAVWAAMDVMVSPSIQPDPFPTSVLEAMACAKPVVAAAHGGPTEMVIDGETGFLVPPGNVDALAVALRTLIDDEDLRRAMGLAGRRRMEEHFSIEEFIGSFESLYDELG